MGWGSILKKVGNAASGISTGGLWTSGGGGLLQGNNLIDTAKSIAGGKTSEQEQKEAEKKKQASIAAALSSGEQKGLALGELGYGQGLAQTGQDIQRLKGLQTNRTAQSGADPVSAAIMGQKASAMANAQRNLAQSGVKGGTAAGAMDAISRQRDADIAASLYGQQRQSIQDERSMASNMLSGTTGLMFGSQANALSGQMPQLPRASGLLDFLNIA